MSGPAGPSHRVSEGPLDHEKALSDAACVLVVGTTPDYIQLIDERWPGRAAFLTQRELRATASEPPPARSIEFLCDLADWQGALRSLSDEVNQRHVRIVGVTCYDCESLLAAAHIAQERGLPFASPEAVVTCRSKMACKERWRAAGVPCPRSALVRAPAETLGFQAAVDGPIVLKPLSGSGSELTFLCRNQTEVAAAMATLSTRLAEHCDERMFGELAEGRTAFVVEEFVEGAELSADLWLNDGRAQLVRVASKLARPGDFGTTLAYVVPGELPDGLSCEALTELLAQGAAAVGLESGLCMADLIVRGGKGVLLEMAPRPGGDCLPDLVLEALGIDIIGAALDVAEGRALSLAGAAGLTSPHPVVGLRLFAERAGVVTMAGLGRVAADPRVAQCRLKHGRGHRVVLPPEDYDSRILGHVLFRPTPGESIDVQCRELSAAFTPEIEDEPCVTAQTC